MRIVITPLEFWIVVMIPCSVISFFVIWRLGIRASEWVERRVASGYPSECRCPVCGGPPSTVDFSDIHHLSLKCKRHGLYPLTPDMGNALRETLGDE